MAYFLRSGNTFRVSSKEAMDLHEKLPAGNYTIKKDSFENLYLETIDKFQVSGKIYGDTTKYANRILNTFGNRSASTGVLLNGEKGSGKTLLAKMLSVKAAEQGIPTIVLNAPWSGDKFNSFLQTIEQPCIILFDEFEKVYDREDQEAILTLLDGVFPSKKLFVLTCNDKYRIDSHMRNRPGRIFYMLDFKGLDADFITEYCTDMLDAKEHIPSICKIAAMFNQFNFDMLKALVEEMNRYNETPQDAMRMLNAKPEFSSESKYQVMLQIDGIDISAENIGNDEWSGNPLNSNIHVDYKVINSKTSDGDDPDYDWESSKFDQGNLKQIDPANGKFTFVNSNGERLVLNRIKEKGASYWDLF